VLERHGDQFESLDKMQLLVVAAAVAGPFVQRPLLPCDKPLEALWHNPLTFPADSRDSASSSNRLSNPVQLERVPWLSAIAVVVVVVAAAAEGFAAPAVSGEHHGHAAEAQERTQTDTLA
jgi:hypothetical protein